MQSKYSFQSFFKFIISSNRILQVLNCVQYNEQLPCIAHNSGPILYLLYL